MSELEVIDHAAQILFTVGAAGAAATAQGIAEQGGAQIYDAGANLWARLRHRFGDRPPDEAAVVGALRAAIDEGDVTHEELASFVQLGQSGGVVLVSSRVKNFFNAPVHTRTFNA